MRFGRPLLLSDCAHRRFGQTQHRMRIGRRGHAREQVACRGPQHKEGQQEKQDEGDAAEHDHRQKAWLFAPIARIMRYAMDKWLNHISLDARIGGGAA